MTGCRFRPKPRSVQWRFRGRQRPSNSWLLTMDPFCPIYYAKISIVYLISLSPLLRTRSSAGFCATKDYFRAMSTHLLIGNDHTLLCESPLYHTPHRLPTSSNSTRSIHTTRHPTRKACWKVWWEKVLDCFEMGEMSCDIQICHPLF